MACLNQTKLKNYTLIFQYLYGTYSQPLVHEKVLGGTQKFFQQKNGKNKI